MNRFVGSAVTKLSLQITVVRFYQHKTEKSHQAKSSWITMFEGKRMKTLK